MSDGILKGNGYCRSCGIRTCGHEAKAGLCGHCRPLDRGPEPGTKGIVAHRLNNWDALCDRVEAAEAKVDRLCSRGIEDLRFENDELRAEVAALERVADERRDRAKRAEAEVERLREANMAAVERKPGSKVVSQGRYAIAARKRDEAQAEVERLRETVRMACFDLVMLPSEQHEIMRREPWLEAYEREQNGNTAPGTQEKT